jgi:formiminoglutamate deiminase
MDVDAQGVICGIYALEQAPELEPSAQVAIDRLARSVVVPGQVNAHSHAFQRAIRARTQHTTSARDDFWSWRAQMYQVADALTPETIYDVSRQAFEEMRGVGYTSVAEFHYVHHQPDGRRYDDAHVLADAVIRAALDARLRITLLRVAYHEAGPGRAAEGTQLRFVTESVERFLEDTDDLTSRWRGESRVTIGVAPHSARAVPPAWLGPIARFAEDRGCPLHIHVCEQRQEIAQTIAAYGRTPIELLAEHGALTSRTTLVHATHLSARELELIEAAGAIVCACPTTERDLGDGFLPALELLKRGVRICTGSDSHTVINPWEELRLIEYHERLRYERRHILTDAYERWHPEHEGPRSSADLLWPMNTTHGAAACGFKEGHGALEVGAAADMVALDLDHASLRGVPLEVMSPAICLSMAPDALSASWTGGERTI